MKNVRIFYTKKGRMRFVSHLDMTRFMSRLIAKTKIPIWFTEGFHPHAYITFALPLSLGFESEYEVMDIRLTDDDFPLEEVVKRLNGACPEYIKILKAAEPVRKAGEIGFAEFEIVFDTSGKGFADNLKDFLNRDSIPVKKPAKRGGEKEIDLIPAIIDFSVKDELGQTVLNITLPAGSDNNINPTLVIDAFYEQTGGNFVCHNIKRLKILDKSGRLFE